MKNRLYPWILIASLLASSAGAAAGTVLSGQITGNVNVSVSQPIQIEKPVIQGLPTGRATFSAVSDTNTEFSAAATLYQGEDVYIKIPIKNQAKVPHVVEITVNAPTIPVPQGGHPGDYTITLDVLGGGDPANLIDDVVRVGANKWKCTVDAGAAGLSNAWVKVVVALGDMVPPGYYQLSGEIKVVSY